MNRTAKACCAAHSSYTQVCHYMLEGAMNHLDVSVVREFLSYAPQTGQLFWKRRDERWFADNIGRTQAHAAAWWNSRFAGQEALTAINSSGYRTGAILGVSYKAHRVAWAIETGAWAVSEIDHIDGNRSNNRWSNLRLVDYSGNRQNMKKYSTNKSGVVGATFRRGGWEVTISVCGKRLYVGRFRTIEEAGQARLEAELNLGFHPNHGR